MNYGMFLYIDPATGGMLFTVIFGLISAGAYFLRTIIFKIKYSLCIDTVNKKTHDKLPIVIFSDHKRYWNVFEPICDELESRKQRALFYTMSEDDPALEKKYTYIECVYIGSGNKAFSKMNMLKACVVVSTTPSLDVFQWRRSKDVDYYIHVQHAANDISMYRMFGTDYYDAILLSGEYQIEQVRKLESLRGLPPKDLQLVGIPYMDEMKKRLDKMKINYDGTRTVLLAPSWGKNGILNKYGDKLIDALIETGYNIIIRPHPQSYTSEKKMLERIQNKYSGNANIEWNKDNDNFEVLRRADILISDFSGIIFDFALVYDKPIIYADISYNKAYYDCAWIEDELWTFNILKYLGKQLDEDNVSNIKKLIDECVDNPIYQEGREKARNETWIPMGVGASCTVDFIFDKFSKYSIDKNEIGLNDNE